MWCCLYRLFQEMQFEKCTKATEKIFKKKLYLFELSSLNLSGYYIKISHNLVWSQTMTKDFTLFSLTKSICPKVFAGKSVFLVVMETLLPVKRKYFNVHLITCIVFLYFLNDDDYCAEKWKIKVHLIKKMFQFQPCTLITVQSNVYL